MAWLPTELHPGDADLTGEGCLGRLRGNMDLGEGNRTLVRIVFPVGMSKAVTSYTPSTGRDRIGAARKLEAARECGCPGERPRLTE